MTIEGQLLDDVWTLELDSWQWTQLQTFGAAPCARKGRATQLGSLAGQLAFVMWQQHPDNNATSSCTALTARQPPCSTNRPAGASLCATEDGRRLYLFGGHDGNGPLNDCHYLEVEQLLWNSTEPAGTPPEPREGHMAAVLGRYLLVSGGCGQTAVPPSGPLAGGAAAAAAGSGVLLGQQPSVVESLQGTAAGPAGAASIAGAAAAAGAPGSAGTTLVGKRLTDTFVLDMDSGPCWEQLDDGSSINAMWLKQVRLQRGRQLAACAGSLAAVLTAVAASHLSVCCGDTAAVAGWAPILRADGVVQCHARQQVVHAAAQPE